MSDCGSVLCQIVVVMVRRKDCRLLWLWVLVKIVVGSFPYLGWVCGKCWVVLKGVFRHFLMQQIKKLPETITFKNSKSFGLLNNEKSGFQK